MGIFFWFIMAFIVGMVAHSKSRNAFGWFIYGLLIWPIALVHALLLRDETPAPPLSSSDRIARLAELEKLREIGTVTQEQYEHMKADVIGVLRPAQTPITQAKPDDSGAFQVIWPAILILFILFITAIFIFHK